MTGPRIDPEDWMQSFVADAARVTPRRPAPPPRNTIGPASPIKGKPLPMPRIKSGLRPGDEGYGIPQVFEDLRDAGSDLLHSRGKFGSGSPLGVLADLANFPGMARGVAAGVEDINAGNPKTGTAIAALSMLPLIGGIVTKPLRAAVKSARGARAVEHKGVEELRLLAERLGADPLGQLQIKVDPAFGKHFADVYESLPKLDPKAKSAYDAMNTEIEHQFAQLQKSGFTFEFVDENPYKNSAEMVADLQQNKRLKVFKTPATDFHPYMTPEQNDRLRAVHDAIAHGSVGNQFGPIGEERAYRVHAGTLSPKARQALATETRGQNSWVNFGPNSKLPATERPFAEQKAALWPAELTGPYESIARPAGEAKPYQLSHFSPQRRERIDPNFEGTGPVKGEERQRAGVPKSFYFLEGTGRYEAAFDPKYHPRLTKHELSADLRLYDPTTMSDPVVEKAFGRNLKAGEQALQRAGFEGYLNLQHPASKFARTAAIFKALDVPTF